MIQTKTKPEIQVDIRQTGVESARVYAPFDETLEALTSEGYKIISLPQNARLRMQQEKDSYISRNGNWTREGFVYVPKKGKFLTKSSPIMQNPREATQAHRNGKHYFLADEQVDQALADSIQIQSIEIPTNRFGENEITAYAFGDVAEQYGQFLREEGINEMSILLYDLQDKPFATQLWFGNLSSGSSLSGYGGDLNVDGRLRGVKELNKSNSNTR